MITEHDLTEIERTQMPTIEAASIVRRLTNEVRRLRAIETAAKKYRNTLYEILGAITDEDDEHDTEGTEAAAKAVYAAVWHEDGAALDKLLHDRKAGGQ